MFLYDIYIDTDIFIFLLINYFTPFFLTLESCSLGLIGINKVWEMLTSTLRTLFKDLKIVNFYENL